MHSSISGPRCLLLGRAWQDDLPGRPAQSAAGKPPGAQLVEPSLDSQMLPPPDTLRLLNMNVKHEFFCCVFFFLTDNKIWHHSCESFGTCVGKLPSKPSDLNHSFISQPVVLTKLWSATGKFTSAHSTCSRSRREKKKKIVNANMQKRM